MSADTATILLYAMSCLIVIIFAVVLSKVEQEVKDLRDEIEYLKDSIRRLSK